MKFKSVPEPPADLETVANAHRAVALVAEPDADCCARVGSRLDVSREGAREWLAFLRALGLVVETDAGFRRRRRDVDRTELAEMFRERVYGATDVLAILEAAEEPLAPAEVYERFEERIPTWERFRHADPDAVWSERVRRLLEWALLFGLADRTDDGYRRHDRRFTDGSYRHSGS